MRVIHFDGHGVFDARAGRGQLAFEDAGGGLDTVAADRLGALIDTDAGSVVAMPCSVLVKTSAAYFRAFYAALARGDSIGRAADEGRWALLEQLERFPLHHSVRGEIAVELKDWFLPVLYQRGRDPAPFATAAPESDTPAPGAADGLLGPVPAAAEIPPRGRAADQWRLERRLQAEPLVFLHGLPGQGMTALAAVTARWLLRTGRIECVLWVSFLDGGDRDSTLPAQGQQLVGDGFADLPPAERLPRLRQALAERPTLIRGAPSVPGGAGRVQGPRRAPISGRFRTMCKLSSVPEREGKQKPYPLYLIEFICSLHCENAPSRLHRSRLPPARRLRRRRGQDRWSPPGLQDRRLRGRPACPDRHSRPRGFC